MFNFNYTQCLGHKILINGKCEGIYEFQYFIYLKKNY